MTITFDSIIGTCHRVLTAGCIVSEVHVIRPQGAVPTGVDGIPLPAFLRRLYEHHFAMALLDYWHRDHPHISFGGRFAIPVVDALTRWRVGVVDAAENVLSEGHQEYYEMWNSSVPFYEVGNGDYLAFNYANEVLYLSHDDESFVIGPTLESFFEHWESLLFVHPIHFDRFLDGFFHLNAETEYSRLYRTRFETLMETA